MEQITEGLRVYTIESAEEAPARLRADMISRGWDGRIYIGISLPVGRQRRAYRAMFHRAAKTGRFERVL